MSSGRAVPAVIPATAGSTVVNDDTELERATLRRVSGRLLPLLFIVYVVSFLDRTNLGIAKLQMGRDLGWLSESVYGLGAGIFFVGYALFEVPSNVILARVGARRWLARIMITWGLIASAMMFVRTPIQFYALRLLLGIAEAGCFPGIVYYLSEWFPAPQRARAMSRFMISIPLGAAIGNPLSAWLLRLDGRLGLAGWQWIFFLEGIPALVLGVALLRLLTDRPNDAAWLSAEQRGWLVARLAREAADAPPHVSPLHALAHPVVWLAALPYFVLNALGYGFVFWAPTLIRDGLRVSTTATGLITGAIAGVAALAMLGTGWSSDRMGERVGHATVCILVSGAGCVAAALSPSPLARVGGLALVFIGVEGSLPPFWCVPIAVVRGSAAAAAIGLVNAVGTTGGFAGPYVIGLLKEATGGTTGAFLGLAGLSLAGAALLRSLGRQVSATSRGGALGRGAATAAPVG